MKQITSYIQEGLRINKNIKIHKHCPESISEFRKIIENKYKDNHEVLDLSDVDVSKMTTLENLFNYNNDNFTKYKVKKIIGVGSWDIRNVKKLSKMFTEMGGLEEIDGISDWDVSNVESMFGMFQSCYSLKELDLSSWNTKNLKTTTSMFNGCTNIKSIGDISDWNISNLGDCQNMFYGCKKLVLDIKKWGLKKVTSNIKSWEINSWADKVII